MIIAKSWYRFVTRPRMLLASFLHSTLRLGINVLCLHETSVSFLAAVSSSDEVTIVAQQNQTFTSDRAKKVSPSLSVPSQQLHIFYFFICIIFDTTIFNIISSCLSTNLLVRFHDFYRFTFKPKYV